MSAWGPTRPVPVGAPPQPTCLSDVERSPGDPRQEGEDDLAEEGYCLYPESQVTVVPSSNTDMATSDGHSSIFLSHCHHPTGSNVFLSGGSGGDLFLSQGESSMEEGQYYSSTGTASLASCEDAGRDGSWLPSLEHTARVTSRVSSSDISDASSIYPLSPSSENAATLSTSECDEGGHVETDKGHRVPGCYTCMGKSLSGGSNTKDNQTETGSSFHSFKSNISSISEERQCSKDSDNWPSCLSLSLSFCDASSVDEICDFESIVPQDDDDILSLSELCANSEETHIVTFNGEAQRRSNVLVDRPDRTFYPLQDKLSSQSMETALDKSSDEASSADQDLRNADQDLGNAEHTGKRMDLRQTLSNEKCVSIVSSNVPDTEAHETCCVELRPITYDLKTSVIMPRGICSKKEKILASDDTTRCQPNEKSLFYSSTHSSSHTWDVSPHTSYSGGFKSSLQPQLSRGISDHVAHELAKTAIAVSLQETANEIKRNTFEVIVHSVDEDETNFKTSPSEQKQGANEEHKTSIEDSTGHAKTPLKSAWMKNVIKKFESWSDFKSCIDIASTVGDTHEETVAKTVDANKGHCSEKNNVPCEPRKDRLIPAVQQNKCLQHAEQRGFNGLWGHKDNRCVNVSSPADENGVAEGNWHPKVQYPVCVTETHIAQQLQDKAECVLPVTYHNMQQPCDVDEKNETLETDSETGCRECVMQPTSPLPAIPPKAIRFVSSEHQHSYHRTLRDACHAEQKRILAFHSSPNTILCEIDGKVGHPKMFATYERLIPTDGHCDELSGSEDCDKVKVGRAKQKNSFWKGKRKNKACRKGEQDNFFNNIGSQTGVMEYAVYILPNNILEKQNSASYCSVFAEEKSAQLSHNLSQGTDRKSVEIANSKRAKIKKRQRPSQKPCGPVEKCGDPQSVMSRLNGNVHSGKWNKKNISNKMSACGIISTASGTVNKNRLPGIRDPSVIKRATDEQLCQIVAQYTKNYITEVLTGITSLAEKGSGHRQALDKKGQSSNKGLQTDLREEMGDSTFFDPSHQLNLCGVELKVTKEVGGKTESEELQTVKSIPYLTSGSTIDKTETTSYSVSNTLTWSPNDRLVHNIASAFVAALVLSGKCEQLAHKVLDRAEKEMATYMMHCRKQQMSMSSTKPLSAAPYSETEIRERITAAASSLIQKAFGQLQIKLEEKGLTGKNYPQKQDSEYKWEAYEIATSCILGAIHDNSFEKACSMPELWPSHASSSNIRKVIHSTISSSKLHMADHKSQTYIPSQMPPTQLRSSLLSRPPTSDVSQSLYPQGGTGSVSEKDHDVQTRPACPSPRYPDTDYDRYKMLVEPSKYPLPSSCGRHESDIGNCVIAENQDGSMKETSCFDQNNTKPLQEQYASQYYSRRIQCALCKKQ